MNKAAPVAILLAASVSLAACGSSSSSGDSSASGSSGSKDMGGTGGSSSMHSALGARTINGAGNVLTTSDGMTLYLRTTDKNGKVTCTGGCATTWPPFIAKGSLPKLPQSASGKLASVTRPDNGDKQVTYDGHPLYTYVGDHSPGQANGQGLSGIWYAMKTSGASGDKGGGNGNSGGYGY